MRRFIRTSPHTRTQVCAYALIYAYQYALPLTTMLHVRMVSTAGFSGSHPMNEFFSRPRKAKS